MTATRGARSGLVLLLMSAAMPAFAAEIDPIIVTAPGAALDRDDAQVVHSLDIERSAQSGLLSALARGIAGVTLQDAQGNPWQANLVYRGFVASPLQGQAQGLATYLDGARFNQPFGDTVQFDLLPDGAIRSMTMMDASPVYGLNALGGALLLETKTGISDPGLAMTLGAGRYGERTASGAAGWNDGRTSMFLALQHSHDGGWRRYSPSTLTNAFADFGHDGSGAGIHLKLIAADTDLVGNGVAPVELLAVDRRAIFTRPDQTLSRYQRASLHPWVQIADRMRIEATLYVQHLRHRTANGDLAEIEPCEDDAQLLCLDEEDVLTDLGGNPIAATSDAYGVFNRARTKSDAGGGLVQLVSERPLGSLANHVAMGLSLDVSRTGFGASTELGTLDETRGVDGLGTIIRQPDGLIAPVSLTARTTYWGFFLQDKLSLTDRLSVELGLRYNRAAIRLRDRIGTALNGDHRFSRLNPGIEIDYEVRPGLVLRAGYAESNRVPTPAELSCADPEAPCSLANFFIADPPLRQVIARSWETGATWEGNVGGFVLNALLSAYRTSNRNDINYVASSIRGRAYFLNIGRTRRQGVELNLKARRDGLTAALNYAFTDATHRSALTLSSPANPAADAEGTITVRPGDRLPGIPRHTLVASLDYEGRGWSLGGDLVLRSGQYLAGDDGNAQAPVPGYALVHVRGGITLLPNVTLFGEVRNLFNRRYATFGTFSEVDEIVLAEAPDASDPRAYGPGAVRRWTTGIRMKF